MYIVIVFCIFLIVCISILQYVLAVLYIETSYIALQAFFSLCMIYIIVIIGFSMIYFLIDLHQAIFVGRINMPKHIIWQLYDMIYFSGVTMLTIGYGDIAPIGIGRMIAIIQALMGYVLPTAFVLKLMQIKKG